MTSQPKSWLAAPNVSWTWGVIASLVWGVGLILAYTSNVGVYLESRLARPVDFAAREALGKSPDISDKLKIYNIDDSTFAKLGSWVLSLDEWVNVLETVSANKPRAIVIDAMFSKADDMTGNLSQAVERLGKLGTRVVVGSFVTASAINYRDVLQLDGPETSLAALTGKGPGAIVSDDELPPLVDRRQPHWYAYGPAPALRPVLRNVGHFLYTDAGLIAPMIRVGDDQVVSHISLYAANERRIHDGRLMLDGHIVPVDAAGQVTINFVPPAKLYQSSNSMRGLLALVKNGKPSKLISEGDVVLILPQMYTGNTDFKQTPFGVAPGGFVIASMLNSVLTGQWLKPLSGGEALIFALALAGAFCGMQLGAVAFWSVLLLALAGIVALSEYLFAFHSIVVPWLFPATAFLGVGISVFAEKTRVGEKKVRALRQALEGAVPAAELKSILRRPEKISLEARERVVTLMFIDVVGFSLLAENMLPRIAFENLKKMLSVIGESIHQYGGIIDKTLGDGLLCYFGYHFDGDASRPDHAEQALRCAVKIQRDNLERNLEAARLGDPVYPLRIGINTASCYLGDLGSQNRIDFTVVGNGVNFAKRLEGACGMHSVLVGSTTNDLVKGTGLPADAVSKRLIRIKHHSELVEAYEYDPFHGDPGLRAKAIEAFRKCANIERVDQRWPVRDPAKIEVTTDHGNGQLVNFSHTGLSIRLNQLLARGTRLKIYLDAGNGALKDLLAQDGVEVIDGEVRWGYAEGSEFVHGILMTNLNPTQSDRLVANLSEFAFARKGAA